MHGHRMERDVTNFKITSGLVRALWSTPESMQSGSLERIGRLGNRKGKTGLKHKSWSPSYFFTLGLSTLGSHDEIPTG